MAKTIKYRQSSWEMAQRTINSQNKKRNSSVRGKSTSNTQNSKRKTTDKERNTAKSNSISANTKGSISSNRTSKKKRTTPKDTSAKTYTELVNKSKSKSEENKQKRKDSWDKLKTNIRSSSGNAYISNKDAQSVINEKSKERKNNDSIDNIKKRLNSSDSKIVDSNQDSLNKKLSSKKNKVGTEEYNKKLNEFRKNAISYATSGWGSDKSIAEQMSDAVENKNENKKNALGGDVEKRESGSRATVQGNLEKIGARLSTRSEIGREIDKEYALAKREYESQGYIVEPLTKEERSKLINERMEEIDWKSYDRNIDNSYGNKVSSEDLTSEDYLRLGTASLMGGNSSAVTSALGDKLSKKIASRTAYDYTKDGSRVAMGFIEGMNYGDNTSIFRDYYNQNEINAISEGERSKSYMGGYMVGQGINFAIGGSNSLGSSLAKNGIKNTIKGVNKPIVESISKHARREALYQTLSATPLNTLDAYKMATDTDGNTDMGQFAMYMTLNTGLDFGIGRVFSGISGMSKKKSIETFAHLQHKIQSGQGNNLTIEERRLYNRIIGVERSGQKSDTGYYEFDNALNSGADLRKTKREFDNAQTMGNISDEQLNAWRNKMHSAQSETVSDTSTRNISVEKSSEIKPQQPQKIQSKTTTSISGVDSVGAKSNKEYLESRQRIDDSYSDIISTLNLKRDGDEIIDFGGEKIVVDNGKYILKTDGMPDKSITKSKAMKMIENARRNEVDTLESATPQEFKTTKKGRAGKKDISKKSIEESNRRNAVDSEIEKQTNSERVRSDTESQSQSRIDAEYERQRLDADKSELESMKMTKYEHNTLKKDISKIKENLESLKSRLDNAKHRQQNGRTKASREHAKAEVSKLEKDIKNQESYVSEMQNRLDNAIIVKKNADREKPQAPTRISDEPIEVTEYKVGDNGKVVNPNKKKSSRKPKEKNNGQVEESNIRNEQQGQTGVRENDGRVQGESSEHQNNTELNSGRNQSNVYGRVRKGNSVKGEKELDTLKKHGVDVDSYSNVSSKPNEFTSRVDSNAKSQKFGASVDIPTPEKGDRLFGTLDGDVTVAIHKDGDIFAVSKRAGSRHDFADAMYIALANGGDRLDAYGKGLVRKYEQYGFEPVARVKYSEDVVREFNPPDIAEKKIAVFNEMKKMGNEPDVYVFRHNGDSLDSVIKKRKSGEFRSFTDEELDNLPFYESDGYMDALEYRDNLIKESKENKIIKNFQFALYRFQNADTHFRETGEPVPEKTRKDYENRVAEFNKLPKDAQLRSKNEKGEYVFPIGKKPPKDAPITVGEVRELSDKLKKLEREKAKAKSNLENMSSQSNATLRQEAEDEFEKITKEYDDAVSEYNKVADQYRKTHREEMERLKDEERSRTLTPEEKSKPEQQSVATENKSREKSEVEKLIDKKETGAEISQRKVIDSLIHWEKLAKLSDKPHKILSKINVLRTSKGRISSWIDGEGRALFSDTRPTGKSLNNIYIDAGLNGLKKVFSRKQNPVVAQRIEDFQEYVWLNHHIDRYYQGKNVYDMTDVDAVQRMVELERKYANDTVRIDGNDVLRIQQFNKEIVEYTNDLHKYKYEAGLESKETFDMLNSMYANYVPTHRESEFLQAYGNRISDDIRISNNLKRAVGSNKKLVPLYDQLVAETNKVIKSSDENHLMNAIAEIQGVKVSDIDKTATVDELIDASVVPNIDNGTYGITYFENGVAKRMQVSEGMYRGMMEWTGRERADVINFGIEASRLTRTMQTVNHAYKALITDWNYIFGFKNIWKDVGTAVVFTQNKAYIRNIPRAFKEIMTNGDMYKLYISNGGRHSTLVDAHASSLRSDTFLGISDAKFTRLAKKISPPEVNSILETIPRITEFMLSLEKYAKETGEDLASPSREIVDRAMYDANDITTNFGRSGVVTKSLNSNVIPFLNPSIQGLDKLVRMCDPRGKEWKEIASFAGKVAGLSIAPSVLNEFMHSGNVNYQHMNKRDQDNYFFITIPNTDGEEFIKIPKSRETSVLAMPVNYLIRGWKYGKKNGIGYEWKSMFKDADSLIGPVKITENIFTPAYQSLISKKTWYGEDLLNSDDLNAIENHKPEEVYSSSTSELAKFLGNTYVAKQRNLTPKQIDSLMDGYLGVMYDFFIKPSDANGGMNYVKSSLVLDTVFSNRDSTDFWSKQNELLSAKEYTDSDEDKEKYDSFANKYVYDASTLSSAMRDISDDTTLTNKEKAMLKRELKKSQNVIYRQGISELDPTIDPIGQIRKSYLNCVKPTNQSTISTSSIDATDKALSYLYKNGNFGKGYESYKDSVGYSDKTIKQQRELSNEYFEVYSTTARTQMQLGESKSFPDYKFMSISVCQNEANGKVTHGSQISSALDLTDNTRELAKQYVKDGGNMDTYKTTYIQLNSVTEKLGDEVTKDWGLKAMSLAENSSIDREYKITDVEKKINPARCLTTKYKWDTEKYNSFRLETGVKGTDDKATVMNAIEQYASNKEERAALYQLITGRSSTPYGTVGTYNLDGDVGHDNSSSSGGRRGYSHRRRRGGGGSGGGSRSNATGNTSYYSDWLKKMQNGSSIGGLDDAFRTKQLKILKNTTSRITKG